MKLIHTYILLYLLFLGSGCKAAEEEEPAIVLPQNSGTPVFINLSISTNKACYLPGEEVRFTMNTYSLPSGVKVRYKHLNAIINEQDISKNNWTWQTPYDDFKGYTAEVYSILDSVETIYAVTGIDVSSDWKKFPRYGFISSFNSIADSIVSSVIANLNRHHINGLQFYDWQNKHHKPLPLNDFIPTDKWKDIGNRDITLSSVKAYIKEAHSHNMKAMFYDLVYGAWNNAEADGVKKEWYMYSDNTHTNIDLFSLSAPFISNLYFLDPGNTEWQNYMKKEVNTVYQHLGFDGYHMDQVGDRGKRYRYDGSPIDLASSFGSYIDVIETVDPAKYNVMNAVAQFGQQSIASAATDFLYSEIWSPWDNYNDLANIIKQNNSMCNNTKNSVLAAYINYDLGENKGNFNTPSVLMADAVIFAFGGSHLELGEHMLCKEYFPNNNLTVKDDLKKALISYYDFMVAYQNLLRDSGNFNSVELICPEAKLSLAAWPASQGKVAYLGRKTGSRQVIHLINFTNSTTMKWRDNKGIQAMPAVVQDANLIFTADGTIKNMWVASPDVAGGVSLPVNFVQNGNKVSFVLPELKYWDMVVVEYYTIKK